MLYKRSKFFKMSKTEFLKTLILTTAALDEQLVLNIIKEFRHLDILIINYATDNLDILKLQELAKNFDFDSFDAYSPKTRNIDEIELRLSDAKENSLVFIIGLEKILINTTANKFQIKSGDKIFNLHSYDNIDSIGIMSLIDALYKKFNFHFLFLAHTSVDVSDRVVNDLEKYDIEILSIKNESDNLQEIEADIFQTLKNSPYEDALELLEKYKSALDERSIRHLQVTIWRQHGFQDKIIKFLTTNFEILHDSEKKHLADSYYFDEKYHEAYEIASSIAQHNPMLLGLNTLLLKTAIKLNKFEEIYESVLGVDKTDIKALEITADYFEKHKIFDKAIKFYERLFGITKEPYYLLLLEILRFEHNKPKNGHIAERQIVSVLSAYSDENLGIEKSYRLGRIWFDVYNSPYMAYYHFNNVLKICYNIHSIDAAKYRMELLANHGYSNKIIKTGYQKKYPDRLPTIRIKELFNSLLILTCDKTGYLSWQEFIDKAQTKDTWKKYLSARTINTLREVDSKININDIHKSIIFNDFKDNELIEMITLYKKASLSDEQINTIKESSEAIIVQSKNILEHIWIRYYVADFFIHIGEMQLANNHAISLWHLANHIDDFEAAKVARLLGTLSWGVAQYKNGKEIEGIACIAVTIKHFIEIQEIVPFLEDGLKIINIWIQSNKELFSEVDFEFFIQFFKRLTPRNANQNEVYEYIAKKDWNAIYNLLGYKVYNPDKYDSQWVIDFYYYVIATAHLEHIAVDFDLIMNNIDRLVDAFAIRKDQRAKLLYSFAHLIFMNSENKYLPEIRWKASLKLLNISIQDLEEKRKTLKNTYERSFISDDSRGIYKFFLLVNLFLFENELYSSEIEKVTLIKNVINAFDYLSLRTLKETKINKAGSQITTELESLEKEYLRLTDELSQYSFINFKEAFLTTEYEEKSKRYAELRRILEEQHPVYMNDSYYEEIPMTIIQSKMHNDEIYYQYTDTEIFVCYLLITKDFIDFGLIKSEAHFDRQVVKDLAQQIQSFSNKSQYDMKDIEKSYFSLSSQYFKPLLAHIQENKYKKVYINHDLSLPLISSNLIRLRDGWLVESVDSIVNLVNKNYFFDRNSNVSCKFSIANLGKASDKQFLETNKWINASQIKNNIEDFECNLVNIADKMRNNASNSLLIISHGIKEENKNILTGALSIEGELKTYTVDDFKFINGLECVSFLSCSGGLLSTGEHETSNAIINNILSKNVNSVVLCRWDVFLEPSLKIFEVVLNANGNIDESLNAAIKKYLQQKQNLHPVFWAGLEVWKN